MWRTLQSLDHSGCSSISALLTTLRQLFNTSCHVCRREIIQLSQLVSSFSYYQSRESPCFFILLNNLWWGCCALTPGRSSPFQWWSWSEGSGWRSILCNTQGFKGSLTRDFRAQVFSWISVPQTHKYSIPLGPFWIFSKICGDIRELMFIAGVNDTDNFSAVSTTPANIESCQNLLAKT